MSQQEVWDVIAYPWQEFKKKQPGYLIEFIKSKKGKILDLACGSGRNFVKSDELKFYGVDFSEKILAYAKEQKIAVELKKSDASSIPYPDDFFDAAIFIAGLHCIDSKDKREKSLRELFRVMKKGTEALIAVWGKNQERIKNKPKECTIPWTVDGKKYYRYCYIYDKEELQELLKKTGFKIIKSHENDEIIVIIKKP